MEYRTLTGTGIKVSRLCLGAMTFGEQVREADAITMVHRALDAGVSFFDTADVYNQGASESILGKALKGRRDEIVLASKVRNFAGGDERKDAGLHRWHLVHAVERSLKRLGTECLDIYYLHTPDRETPLEESLTAADQLVRQGKVMYIGMSNYAAWQVCQALWICDRRNLQSPTVMQPVYNLITRGIEQELLPCCREFDLGVVLYNPLAAGLLAGKHRWDKAPEKGTRFQLNDNYYGRYWHESNFRALEKLVAAAEKAGMTPVELALRWLANQPQVDSIIVGASRLEHLEQNLQGWCGELDDETLDVCDAVWRDIRGVAFQYNR